MLGGREFQTEVVGRSQQGTERWPVCPAWGWSVSSRVAAGTLEQAGLGRKPRSI